MKRSTLAALICLLVAHPIVADDAILAWGNGDSLKGTLISADDKTLTWQSPLFSDPLQINLSSLAAVRFPQPESAAAEDDGFRILLKHGDVLSGKLKSITATTLGFDSARFGSFEIARDQVLSLQRTKNSGGLIYSGPRGLDGWQPAFRRTAAGGVGNPIQQVLQFGFGGDGGGQVAQPEPIRKDKPGSWTEEPDGSLATARPDAALFLPLTLPEKFEIELQLRSKKMLSFVLAIGRDPKTGLRLATWLDELVAASGETSFTGLKKFTSDDHSLHVHIFVDNKTRTMTVYSHAGQKLGAVEISGPRGGKEGLLIRNGEWDLSLRRLRVSAWDGTEPRFMTGDESRIQLVDGTVHLGSIDGLSADSATVSIRKNDGTIDVPQESITSVLVTADSDENPAVRGATQLSWNDGSVVSGTLNSISNGAVALTTSYTQLPLHCQLSNAIRLSMTPTEVAVTQLDRLIHAGASLQGSLVVDGEANTPILWKPQGGINASTLKNGGDAKFVRGTSVMHFSEKPEVLAAFPDVIYLTNNDVLPCRLEGCTEDAVQFTSPFTEARSFSPTEVRAVELAASGRIHQRGFGAEGWKGSGSTKKTDPAKRTLRGNSSGFSHASILTGDTIRFHLKWPSQAYASLTVSLFGSGKRTDKDSTHVSFNLMQSSLQVLDRPPQPNNQMFFRGFGGPESDSTMVVSDSQADIQIVAREGNLLVSVDGKQLKAIKLNPDGAGSKGLAFSANMTVMGQVVVNGRVVEGSGDGIEISEFEIDNLSGASIRQFIEEESRQAALTIPRFRRKNPPTHVLIAPTGDLLRGQLKGLNEKDIQFESRLEPLRLDRSRIAAIVWLHERHSQGTIVIGAEPPAADAAADPVKVAESVQEDGFVMEDENDDSLVQAQLADGYSITMTPVRLVNGQIEGHSKRLGKCTFPAASIRELHLGENKDHLASYDQWIAKHAKEPDWDVAASDGGNSAGSKMIGTVAEDFELPLLDGTKFRLKDHADKIVVLDFWATWCGPCVAALPDYIAATSEFDQSKVIFVAVNLQEASDQIRGFLTERNLSPMVALDRNGEIAQKFQVSGIPHTVVLGPGNMVEDVHVGYQQGGGESLQIAIMQMLDGTWKRPEPAADAPDAEPMPKPIEAI